MTGTTRTHSRSRQPQKTRLQEMTTLAPLGTHQSSHPLIFVAIVVTANHFILDAVAGACVCGAAWFGNRALLNLLPLEDYFLWCVRIHKP